MADELPEGFQATQRLPVPESSSAPVVNMSLVTTISGAWFQAIFFTALGVFFIALGFSTSGQIVAIVKHPLTNPIAFLGLFLLAGSSVYLPYVGIRSLFQKLIISNGELSLIEPFKSNTVSLVQLSSVQSRIEAINTRYGEQFKTIIAIADQTGRQLQLPVHMYKKEDMIAKMLLAAVSQDHLIVDADTLKTLQELAGSAGSGAFTPVVASDRMMMSQLKVVLIIAAIAFPTFIVIGIVASKHESKKSATNTAAASLVADEYIRDLGSGNSQAALHLESPNLQSDAGATQSLSSPDFHGVQSSKRIDTSTGTTPKGDYVSYVYEYDGYQKPYYIKIALSKYGGQWRVWLLNASDSKLQAALQKQY